jgi:hypothetical protein
LFNALPIFHSFGLTGGFCCALAGVKEPSLPSPRYRLVPQLS